MDLQPKKVKKVELYRGYLATIPCPRCQVASLYHPKGTEKLIVCVMCNFEDTIH